MKRNVIFYTAESGKCPMKDFLDSLEFSSQIYRLFSFWDKENLIILTHGMIKKSKKTPAKEIKMAEKYKKDYFRRKKNET